MQARYIFGIILVLIGLGFLVDEFTYWSFSSLISTWWPIIIIIVGLVSLTKSGNSLLHGIIITVIGILLLAWKLDYIHSFWNILWPTLLIVVGAGLLFGKHTRKHCKNSSKDSDFNYCILFNGINERIETDNLKSGNIGAFFGGAEIDLREAKISKEGASLDIACGFGGVELLVPENWKIQTSGFPLFGALDNKTQQNYEGMDFVPTLKINYFVMFGGVEIRNKKKKGF